MKVRVCLRKRFARLAGVGVRLFAVGEFGQTRVWRWCLGVSPSEQGRTAASSRGRRWAGVCRAEFRTRGASGDGAGSVASGSGAYDAHMAQTAGASRGRSRRNRQAYSGPVLALQELSGAAKGLPCAAASCTLCARAVKRSQCVLRPERFRVVGCARFRRRLNLLRDPPQLATPSLSAWLIPPCMFKHCCARPILSATFPSSVFLRYLQSARILRGQRASLSRR